MEDVIVTRWTSEVPTKPGLYVMASYSSATDIGYFIASFREDEHGMMSMHVSAKVYAGQDYIEDCVKYGTLDSTFWLPIEECPNA